MSFADTIFQWLPKLRRPDGTLADAQCDPSGSLKVAIVATLGAGTTWVDPENGKPLTNTRTVAALAGRRLHFLVGSNEGTTARWLMVFDLADRPPPNAQPVFSRPVRAGDTFELALPRGRSFLSGITWAASASADKYTEDPAALFRVSAEIE